MGHNVASLQPYNLLAGLSSQKVDELLSLCSLGCQNELKKILKEISGSIMSIHGFAKGGKTTIMVALIFIASEDGLIPLVSATTDLAVGKVALRCDNQDDNEKHLIVHMHPLAGEYQAVMSYDALHEDSRKLFFGKATRGDKYTCDISLAAQILKVGGAVPTKNPKLIKMKEQWMGRLDRILQTPDGHRTSEQWKDFDEYATECGQQIVDQADLVCANPNVSECNMLGNWRHSHNITFIDDASTLIDAELMEVWRGDIPFIIAGNPDNPPPHIDSLNEKHYNGRFVKPFGHVMAVSLLRRLEQLH